MKDLTPQETCHYTVHTDRFAGVYRTREPWGRLHWEDRPNPAAQRLIRKVQVNTALLYMYTTLNGRLNQE